MGPVRDRGDGRYEADVVWSPGVVSQPGLVATQPDRPAVLLNPPAAGGTLGCPRRLCLFLAVALLVAIIVVTCSP